MKKQGKKIEKALSEKEYKELLEQLEIKFKKRNPPEPKVFTFSQYEDKKYSPKKEELQQNANQKKGKRKLNQLQS